LQYSLKKLTQASILVELKEGRKEKEGREERNE